MLTHLLVCCCTCGFLLLWGSFLGCCVRTFAWTNVPVSHATTQEHSIDTMQATAISLAQLAPASDLNHIFVDKAGLDVLLDLLTDRSASASESLARHL